jgi:hypothetical protein
MTKKAIGVVSAVLGPSLSGCGTVCNFAGGVVHPDKEPRVYGGVQRDLDIIEEAVAAKPDNPPNMGKTAVFIMAVALVDPIVSLVADTLTLPITIPIQCWRERAEKKEENSAPNSGQPKSPGVTLDPPVPVDGK